MAGRPKLRRLTQAIERMGEERMWDMLLETGSVVKVCEVLGQQAGETYSRSLWYMWSAQHEDRKMRLKLVREAQAHSMAEESLEILDGATPATISVDRERARSRQWLAERLNRKEYGEEKAGPVINIQNLHLSALQAIKVGGGGTMEAKPERDKLTQGVSGYISGAADEDVIEGEDVQLVVDPEVTSEANG